MRRATAWGRFNADEQATLRKNESQAERVLGPEPDLDATQTTLVQLYYELRRQTPHDRGIAIPDSFDPVVASHLSAMDLAFSEEQRRNQEAHYARSATPPPKPPKQ